MGTNDAPAAATDEPANELRALQPRGARVSEKLSAELVEEALNAGRDTRPNRATRADGWTPERIRVFLNTLAECGVVSDACRAAGMTTMSAYRLRNSAKGRAFLLAWRAALVRARRRLGDDLMSRAVNGCVDLIYRDGKLFAERHRYDNRLSMDVFTRLDRLLARDEVGGAVGIVAEEFEPFVEFVANGGAGAADFIRRRIPLEDRNADEAELLDRAENYGRYGVGLPEEIDISDLEAADSANWNEEQAERASRSRLPRPSQPAADGQRVFWNFQDVVPGATEPLWLPVQTTAAQALAYARAGALGRTFHNLCDDSGAEDGPVAADEVAQIGPAEDYLSSASAASGTGDEDNRAAGGILSGPPPGDPATGKPAPEAVQPRMRAVCAPEDFDEHSGLLPPLGWVAPGR